MDALSPAEQIPPHLSFRNCCLLLDAGLADTLVFKHLVGVFLPVSAISDGVPPPHIFSMLIIIFLGAFKNFNIIPVC